MQNIALLLAIAIPVVLILLLRSNGAIVFLSLCAGALLVRFVGNEASLVGSAVGNNSSTVSQYFQLSLLLLPVVLSTIFMRKTMTGPKMLFNIPAALAVGAVGVLLAVPLLPAGPQATITGLNGWTLLQRSKEIVVIAGVVASLVVLWITTPRNQEAHKKHKH
jgi:hypothetical protein